MQRWLLKLLLVLGTLAAAPVNAAPRGPLVLAAASLQEALTAAADAYAAQGHPRPVISFAASSVLARQIDAGAPADLFISADADWMDYLATRRLIVTATRASFLTNTLVLVAPASKPFTIAITPGLALLAALADGRLALADPASVPAGKYAEAALTNLGIWATIEPRVVRAENVRSALQFVARGEAAAGIVYATDARASRDVMVAGVFPAGSHPPIVYPLARLTASTNPEAEGFRRFLLSGPGTAIFARYGFGLP